ncbi:MAG: helix-turn-helix domain-containing protein [Oscillospiraceae bacterium]|nr:helix-turn-helix domain-containing protein [Oscillospiraceae bacterium]
MKFSEKLQQLRREHGLSQEMLAERLDVSRQAVSKWESGQAYPEMDKLLSLCNIFNVSLDDLVRDGEMTRGERAQYNSRPFWPQSTYEYKSKRTLFGLPLVHVNIGWRTRAKGIIAVGTIAKGVVSVGLLSVGVVSAGLLSAGLISLGALAFGPLLAVGSIAAGVFAVGAIAIGVFPLGALAIGVYSTGALAIGSHVAVGDHAYGHIAVGRVAEGVRVFIDTSPARNFSAVSATEVAAAIREEFPGTSERIIRGMTRILGR